MKKYYIPTSSLNFNNILSSESISPKAFYPVRHFGYGRWASIPENPFTNSIVLYDELRNFSRPQSTYEDHPLLIEIALDETVESTLSSLKDHIFLCDHTIYIDPYSTRLIFFTENDKHVALSMSDSSIETKFVDLYKEKIVVIAPPTTYYVPIEHPEIQHLNNDEIKKDKRINRMKGLLYGYCIGAILSASKENTIKLNQAREIHNILVAILSSLDRRATSQQRDRLKFLYAAIQPQVSFFSKLSSVIKEKRSFDAVVSIVRDVYGYIPDEINVDGIISQLLNVPTSPDAKNPIIDNINATIKQIEDTISKKAHPISVIDDQVVVCDDSLMRLNIEGLSDNDKKICKAWMNEVLVRDEYTGKISTFKEVLSDDITRKAKDVCETEWKVEWKGSYPEKTLNALRRHVRGSEYSHSWNNDIYSSISALIMRGDDWQKFLEYMQRKEMTDYRLAYAMYGTINGFANLPRDFTDVLWGQERNYISEVYKKFYEQLFGRNVIIPPKSELGESVPVVKVEDHPNTSGVNPESENQSVVLDGFSSIMEKIVNKCKGAQKDEVRYKELYHQSGGSIQKFVDAVKNDKSLNKGKGAQKIIKDFLSNLINPRKTIVAKKNDNKVNIVTSNGKVVQAAAPVIISASRSTDIPAFYAKWLIDRLEAGYCVWYNPFNQQPMYISFKNTKVVVFWTKDPEPMIEYLPELDKRGIHYYFQITLNDYEREGFEPNVPALQHRIEVFKKLSDKIGKEKIIWRFDPLVLTDQLSPRQLLNKIYHVGDQLKGYTNKLVFSFIDVKAYRKVQNNLIKETPYFTRENVEAAEPEGDKRIELIEGLVKLRDYWNNEGWNLALATCAEAIDLGSYDIEHNRCIDGELMERIFSDDKELVYYLRTGKLPEFSGGLFGSELVIPPKNKDLKDKGQRKICGCMISKDIGMYNTCRHFCVYCYANTSKECVQKNAFLHNENSESIIG